MGAPIRDGAPQQRGLHDPMDGSGPAISTHTSHPQGISRTVILDSSNVAPGALADPVLDQVGALVSEIT